MFFIPIVLISVLYLFVFLKLTHRLTRKNVKRIFLVSAVMLLLYILWMKEGLCIMFTAWLQGNFTQ